MPRKKQKTQSQPLESDSAAQAAGVTQRGAFRVAMIGAAATVLVGLMGGVWQWLSKPSSSLEKNKLVVKVIDGITRKNVKGAKVSAEGNGVPVVDSTDDQGIITFILDDPKKELRIRVDANGYTEFSLRITPANIVGVQEVPLTPIKRGSAVPTTTSQNSAKSSGNARSFAGGIYKVRITVLDSQSVPLEDAKVWSSSGGEPKRVAGGVEFDIPTVSVPSSGAVTFYAAKESAFLTGKQTLNLANDYSPSIQIQLSRDSTAVINGTVMDESGKMIQGAVVSVGRGSKQVITNNAGYFEVPANAAKGQVIKLYVEKEGYLPSVSSPLAGYSVEVKLREQP